MRTGFPFPVGGDTYKKKTNSIFHGQAVGLRSMYNKGHTYVVLVSDTGRGFFKLSEIPDPGR